MLGETLEAARQGRGAGDRRISSRCRAILTIEDAIAAASFHSGPVRIARGDAGGDRARARIRFEANWRSAGRNISIWKRSARSPGWTRAAALRCTPPRSIPPRRRRSWRACWASPRNQVTVECLRMGGAFGGKEVQANPWAAIAALGAWKTQAAGARALDARAGHGADRQAASVSGALFERGFDERGRHRRRPHRALFRWRLESGSFRAGAGARACSTATTRICLPALDVTGYVCRTHKTSQTAFRGFGGPQGMLVIEEILDRIARALDRCRRMWCASAISIARAMPRIMASR